MASCSFTHAGHTFTLTVTEQSYDVKANSSVVKWTFSVADNGTWYDSYAKCTVNGSVVYNRSCGWDGGFPAQSGSTSGTLTVNHNTDGTKSINFYLEGYAYYYSTQYTNGSLTLTSLDRTAPNVIVPTGDRTSSSNSITFTINSNVNASQWAYQYKKTSDSSYGSWVYDNTSGTSRTLTISGLATNTQYTVYAAAKKSTNDVWGYAATFDITTLGASTITSAANTTLGENCSVTWTPLDTSFKYKLTFSIGPSGSTWSNTTDFISPSQTTAYNYTVYTIPINGPANKITTSTTDTMTVVLTTYNSSGTQIGDTSSAQFTVTVPSTVTPTLSTVALAEGTASGFSRYVKGLSTLRTTITASGQYGASITEYKVQFGSVTLTSTTNVLTSSTLQVPGTYTATATVTDSRGRSTTLNSDPFTVYDYYAPTGTISLAVASATSIVTTITWDIASVNNQNTKTITITRSDGSTSTSTTVSNPTYSGTYEWTQTGLDTTQIYDYTLTITDKKGSTVYTTGISDSPIVISRLGGGKGVTLFGEAREQGFWIVNDARYIRHDITRSEYLELAGILASAYSSSKTYDVGIFVTQGGSIYECNTAITTAEAWNSSHWDLLGAV